MGNAIIYKCIYRSGLKGFHYTLQSSDGRTVTYDYDTLKKYVRSNSIYVTNLTPTCSNELRMLGTRQEECRYYETIKDIKEKLAVARVLDTVTELTARCKHKYYMIHVDGRNQALDNILYIPEDVEDIGSIEHDLEKTNFIKRGIKGKLKVIGGAGLVNIDSTFERADLSELDLEDFYCINLADIHYPFDRAQCESLHIRRFLSSIRNAVYIGTMFSNFTTTDKIALLNLKFESANNADYMFSNTKAAALLLSNLHFKRLETMENIFDDTNIREVMIKECEFTTKERNPSTSEMFDYCRIDRLTSDNRFINNEFYKALRSFTLPTELVDMTDIQ